MNPNTEYLVKRIEAELERLDAMDTGEGGLHVSVEGDLPDGWVKIADESERVYGLACDFLEALVATAPEDGVDDDGKPSGWVATWQAITDLGHPQFHGSEPGAQDWLDFHDFIGGFEPTEGIGLLVLRTNAGLRYGFAPSDSDYSAFNSTHDFSEHFTSAAEAIEAAREYAAREKV